MAHVGRNGDDAGIGRKKSVPRGPPMPWMEAPPHPRLPCRLRLTNHRLSFTPADTARRKPAVNLLLAAAGRVPKRVIEGAVLGLARIVVIPLCMVQSQRRRGGFTGVNVGTAWVMARARMGRVVSRAGGCEERRSRHPFAIPDNGVSRSTTGTSDITAVAGHAHRLRCKYLSLSVICLFVPSLTSGYSPRNQAWYV